MSTFPKRVSIDSEWRTRRKVTQQNDVRKLEPFSGAPGQDVNLWLQKFETKIKCRVRATDPVTEARELDLNLTGQAETWCYGLHPTERDNLETLKTELKSNFLRQIDRNRLSLLIRTLRALPSTLRARAWIYEKRNRDLFMLCGTW